ncbi:MAG: Uma2 family endonuclease, partial [Clostridia bacterium]|nr:Uma2 family endonuclease [Deltaproteobacteria bacterium]
MRQFGEFEHRKFTTDDVLRMLDAGIVDEDEPLELLDGELVMMSPQGPWHRGLTVLLRKRLEAAYGNSCHVQDHSPVVLAQRSMPEPDIAVIRGDVTAMLSRLPQPADVVLAVEISVTTLRADRAKARLYGESGVPVLWIVNVSERRLEVMSGPNVGGYSETLILDETRTVRLPERSEDWPVV